MSAAGITNATSTAGATNANGTAIATGTAGAVRLCFRQAPGAAFLKLILEIINGAMMPLMVLVVASFINSAIALAGGGGGGSSGGGIDGSSIGSGGGGGSLAPLIVAIVLMAACYAWSQAVHIIIRLTDKSLENALREGLRPQLVQKHARISFALLENPEVLDLVSRVCDNSEKNAAAILNTALGIIRLCVQAIGTLSLLAAHIWWIIPLFIVSAAPIARGLYRKHDVIILDEPTAAIDPIEESNIFRLFKESAQGKTAILVTHRLGSTKIADRILLMDAGQVCELGTHEQLMAQDGKYAKMYREQASWYER